MGRSFGAAIMLHGLISRGEEPVLIEDSAFSDVSRAYGGVISCLAFDLRTEKGWSPMINAASFDAGDRPVVVNMPAGADGIL